MGYLSDSALQCPTLVQAPIQAAAGAQSGWAETFSTNRIEGNEVAAFATGQEGSKEDDVLAFGLLNSLDRSKFSTTRAMSNEQCRMGEEQSIMGNQA